MEKVWGTNNNSSFKISEFLKLMMKLDKIGNKGIEYHELASIAKTKALKGAMDYVITHHTNNFKEANENTLLNIGIIGEQYRYYLNDNAFRYIALHAETKPMYILERYQEGNSISLAVSTNRKILDGVAQNHANTDFGGNIELVWESNLTTLTSNITNVYYTIRPIKYIQE